MEAIDYLNGKYVGELKNGLPHGKGVLKWDSGDAYIGYWQNGKMTGLGRREVGDGKGGKFSRIDGYFVDGQLDHIGWFDLDEFREYL